MNHQAREIKETVIASLLEFSDSTFDSKGFKRRANSLRYDRKLDRCTQSVEVCLEHTPRDNPNAAAAVYPWLTVSIPEVDSIARQMTGADESLLSSAASTLHQPIELLSPKGIGARWYIFQPDSIATAVNEFGRFSTEWVFPFLEEYTTASGVVGLHRAGDERVLHTHDQFLRVIAAMIHCGDFGSADETLEAKFGCQALRLRFAPVFDFVAKSSSAAD